MTKDPATTTPTSMSATSRATAWTALGIAGLIDLAITHDRHPVWPVIAFFAASALVVDARLWRRVGHLTRFLAPAVVSASVTVAAVSTGIAASTPGEAAVLVVVVTAAVRLLSPPSAVVAGLTTTAAVLLLPIREPTLRRWDDFTTALLPSLLVLLLLLVAAVLAGLYLRALDARRQDHVAAARTSERTMMAAELHDFVAHHVTAILAETRMAAMMLDTDTDGARAVLTRIETSATAALASMQHTVTLLRSNGAPHDTGSIGRRTAWSADTDPASVGDDLDGVAGLVDRYGPRATLTCDGLDPNDLPPQLRAAAFRIVREGLTNTRKHANPNSHVHVTLRQVDNNLTVTVTDDGAGHPATPPTTRNGYGLTGLTERVETLNGAIQHGPNPTTGWTLTARIPHSARQ